MTQFKPERTSRVVPEGTVRLLAATDLIRAAEIVGCVVPVVGVVPVVPLPVPEPEAPVAGGLDGVVDAIV